MDTVSFYGVGLPYLKNKKLPGKLIVIEGADGSGRSTQIAMLKDYLEAEGYAVLDTGLKRSNLVAGVIDRAKKGNILGKTTLTLLYCTDFADQLENKIIPSLAAGHIVLADRYIFTLIARDIVRGAKKEWLKKLLGFAIVPDIVFYLQANPEILLHRAFAKYGKLDYWESGMDVHLSTDIIKSFLKYHALLKKEFDYMADEYGFFVLNGEENIFQIQNQMRALLKEKILTNW